MARDNLLLWLFLATLIAGVLIGVWQVWRTKKSQRRSGDPTGAIATAQAVSEPPDPAIRS